MERGFHLPGAPLGRVRPVAFGDAKLGTLELSRVEMRTLLTELRACRPGSDLATRAAAIGRAARRFLDEGDPLRGRALAGLPAVTGFSTPMIEAALPRARMLASRLEEEPHLNPNTRTMEFSLRDPDGYYVTISALDAA